MFRSKLSPAPSSSRGLGGKASRTTSRCHGGPPTTPTPSPSSATSIPDEAPPTRTNPPMSPTSTSLDTRDAWRRPSDSHRLAATSPTAGSRRTSRETPRPGQRSATRSPRTSSRGGSAARSSSRSTASTWRRSASGDSRSDQAGPRLAPPAGLAPHTSGCGFRAVSVTPTSRSSGSTAHRATTPTRSRRRDFGGAAPPHHLARESERAAASHATRQPLAIRTGAASYSERVMTNSSRCVRGVTTWSSRGRRNQRLRRRAAPLGCRPRP